MYFEDNLFHLRSKTGLSCSGICKKMDIGITGSAWSKYEKGERRPSLEKLTAIADFFQVSMDELVRSDLSKARMTITETGYKVEIVPQSASAGYEKGYADLDYLRDALETIVIPFPAPRNARAFPIQGDSMEPLVSDGGYVVGVPLKDASEIKEGQPHLVVTREDGIVLKILFQQAHRLSLHSLNPKYAPYSIEKSEVLQLWKYHSHMDQQTDNWKQEQSFHQALSNLQEEMASIKEKLDELSQH